MASKENKQRAMDESDREWQAQRAAKAAKKASRKQYWVRLMVCVSVPPEVTDEMVRNGYLSGFQATLTYKGVPVEGAEVEFDSIDSVEAPMK